MRTFVVFADEMPVVVMQNFEGIQPGEIVKECERCPSLKGKVLKWEIYTSNDRPPCKDN